MKDRQYSFQYSFKKKPARKKRRWRRSLLLVVFLIFASAGLFYLWHNMQTKPFTVLYTAMTGQKSITKPCKIQFEFYDKKDA